MCLLEICINLGLVSYKLLLNDKIIQENEHLPILSSNKNWLLGARKPSQIFASAIGQLTKSLIDVGLDQTGFRI